MNRLFSRDHWNKLGLLVALAVTITIMIAPNLRLVLPRYDDGDIIPENIIISDDVTLVDEQSTATRREQALSDFPPVYDYDPKLKQNTIKNVGDAFARMRKGLAERRQGLAEALEKIRRNSLAQVETLAAMGQNIHRMSILERQARILIEQNGQLSDVTEPSDRQNQRLEKLRFDLLAAEAQKIQAAQEKDQLAVKLKDLEQQGAKLLEGESRMRQEETQAILTMKGDFEKVLGIDLEEPTFRILHEAQFSKDLEQILIPMLVSVFDEKIVVSFEGFNKDLQAIQIQTLDSDKLERFETLSEIKEVAQLREGIEKVGQDLKTAGEAAAYREGMITLAQRLIRPNLTENKGATERLKQELQKNLSPVYFNMKKGAVVARAGDVATAQQVEIIRALNAYNLANPKYPQIVGTFLIVLLALLVSYRLIAQQNPADHPRFSKLVLMSLLLVVTLLLAQLIHLIVPPLTTVYDFLPARTFNYLIPAALTSMLASILLSFEVAVFLGFVISVCLAIFLGNSLSFFLFSVLGSFVASIPLQNYQSRFSLWQQGFRISLMNIVVLGVLTLLEQRGATWAFLGDLAAAAVNGLGVAFLTATLLPLIEKAFDITTNLRLLELSNMNHPALKELSVRAPGTYHHSIVVGNLSESAAEGIVANPLLVRVASYYHDLGKMLCPLYFVENQGKKNFHDDLPASTSARIIINHVKDGLEIARRYKLGKAIMDIIAQHHGNSLVRYFFHKAQEEQGDLGEEVNESDYRYPGPKPQTKEAGLVMVADVTEAATRSLQEPSPESIRLMVQKLTARIYMEGQLDESGMTFNDFNFIEKQFAKMLISIHHHRIAYPEMKAEPIAAQPSLPTLESPDATPGDSEPDSDAHRNKLGSRRASS